jgi:cellobiose-specific phosphotransferase system component IIB
MDWNLFWIFVVLNVVNVVIQTVKSIATIKCGKVPAAVINAVAYGLYTIVVVYTVCELPLWLKATVVAVANLVGVYVVKVLEEKARKDKLWKVEATLRSQNIEPQYDDCIIELKESNIPFNYIDANKYIIVNCYCATQKESAQVKTILDKYHAKYFVSESKTL